MAVEPPAVLHEPAPVLGAGGGDVEVELVHGDPVGDGHVVDALVRRLPCQEFPQDDTVTGM